MKSNKQVFVVYNTSHADKLNRVSFWLAKRHKSGEETRLVWSACCGIAQARVVVPDEGGFKLGLGESLWCAVCVHGVCVYRCVRVNLERPKRDFLPIVLKKKKKRLQPANTFCQEIFECLHIPHLVNLTSVGW